VVVTSSRPYLLRAMYEWLVDNDLTPQLVINADLDGVVVPRQFVSDGRIVLNVSPGAVRGLDLGNDWIMFSARFSGSPFDISVPLDAVLAVFARENGAGMSFREDGEAGSPLPPEPPEPPDPTPGRPQLKVVK
jgi:stringent starvation protein B